MIKRKKSFLKRFLMTSSKKFKRLHAFKKHILFKKKTKKKRFLRNSTFLLKSNFSLFKKVIF